MNQCKRISAVLALSLLSLVGCSDDDSTEQEAVANVALKSMTSVSDDVYQPGQQITVDFSTETTLLTNEHVGVSFILIEKVKSLSSKLKMSLMATIWVSFISSSYKKASKIIQQH